MPGVNNWVGIRCTCLTTCILLANGWRSWHGTSLVSRREIALGNFLVSTLCMASTASSTQPTGCKGGGRNITIRIHPKIRCLSVSADVCGCLRMSADVCGQKV